jgi:hypothetical protein
MKSTVDIRTLRKKAKLMLTEMEKFRQASLQDGLTQAYNRRRPMTSI